MIKKEVLQILSFLKLETLNKTGMKRTGSILSNQIGRGLDFKDHHPYVIGDDIRFIDWNVSSRLNDIYVKDFYQEKDSAILIFLDISQSMNFSLVGDTKSEIAFQMLILISLFYLSNSYRIKIILYSDECEWMSTNLKSKKELFSQLKEISSWKPKSLKTDHNLPFEMIKKNVTKPSDVFFISDFIGIRSLKKYNSLKKSRNFTAICIQDVSIEWRPSSFLRFFSMIENEGGQNGLWKTNYQKEKQFLQEFFKYRFLEIKTDFFPKQKIIRFFQSI